MPRAGTVFTGNRTGPSWRIRHSRRPNAITIASRRCGPAARSSTRGKSTCFGRETRGSIGVSATGPACPSRATAARPSLIIPTIRSSSLIRAGTTPRTTRRRHIRYHGKTHDWSGGVDGKMALMDWRDIAIVKDPKTGLFHGYITARLRGRKNDRIRPASHGCTSRDLVHWEVHPPAFHWASGVCMKCPMSFNWGASGISR